MSLLVALEGLPNCGKSTTSRLLHEELSSRGISVRSLDVDLLGDAKKLREIAGKYQPGDPTRIFLYWALQFQQEETINKLKSKAEVIIADRFWGSILAIDHFGNKVPKKVLEWVMSSANKPDITFFLDLPLVVANNRKEWKPKVMDNDQFAKKVEAGYRKLAAVDNWLKIDASQNKIAIKEQCLEIIFTKLQKRDLSAATPELGRERFYNYNFV